MSGRDAGGSDERDEDEPSFGGPSSAETEADTEADTETDTEAHGTGDRPRATRDRAGDSSDSGSRAGTSDVTIEDDGVVRWFLRTDDEPAVLVRDVLSSVAIVAVIGLLLFAVSGVWPPLVAVESGSMEPNMERGDLIFVVDEDRFVGDDSVGDTGVVTLENGQGDYEKFGQAGDVIVFRPDGSERQTPVIHRAHFWVEEGENWIETKANEEFVGDVTCEEVRTCPARYDGFVTKGDANAGYDQYRGGARTDVVKPEWITGKATFRIPWLGHVRLFFDEIMAGAIVPVSTGTGTGVVGTIGTVGALGSAGVAAGVGVATRVHHRNRNRNQNRSRE
ncbi:signal peptidase, endoplasmic reticulum-type [Halobiforma haloterrestris]|uniref:Signal peptidase, endoplasmic reticulum-type n=1 Tax=Natronobacterium haloterrestre TaxID=148448 RepID=A0A1I1HAN9_NATHA|nr:S26 family signal peptidase [Halobiforma haloterrestris]SFC20785.1 signal peptidase, endoplasmic reticulum-type [Halobiforma haloterrestris]